METDAVPSDWPLTDIAHQSVGVSPSWAIDTL